MIVYRLNAIPFWTPAVQNVLLGLIAAGLVFFILFYVRKL